MILFNKLERVIVITEFCCFNVVVNHDADSAFITFLFIILYSHGAQPTNICDKQTSEDAFAMVVLT